MKTNKVQWNKPELMVLTRSNPEEAVLVTCKVTGIRGPAYGAKCARDNGTEACEELKAS